MSFLISYNVADKAWAEWIAWVLEEAGYDILIQAWDFRPGGDFIVEMQRAATGTDRTIAVLSENYLKAEYTQPEWANAFARDPRGRERTLVPVRIAPCHPTGLLATRIYVDLVGLGETDARNELLGALEPRGKPAAPPLFPGTDEKGQEAVIRPVPVTHQDFPGAASTAADVWWEKLQSLRGQEPIIVDPGEKSWVQHQIRDAEARIAALGAQPDPR